MLTMATTAMAAMVWDTDTAPDTDMVLVTLTDTAMDTPGLTDTTARGLLMLRLMPMLSMDTTATATDTATAMPPDTTAILMPTTDTTMARGLLMPRLTLRSS